MGMTEDPAGTTNASAVASVDLVQLAVVSLCIVALVVAAFLAPPPVSPSDPGTDQPDQPDERNERTGGGGSDGGGDDSTGGGRVIGDGGRPIPVPGDSPPADVDGCGVVLEDEPVPGTRVTVSVYVDLQPATDVPVQFNGEVIGRTGPGGSVTAPVPYQRELNVSVDVPGVEPRERRLAADDLLRSLHVAILNRADRLVKVLFHHRAQRQELLLDLLDLALKVSHGPAPWVKRPF